MTTTEKITAKVKESFKSEFGYDATNVSIDLKNNYANADNYWCKLNSKGVKLNSWRLS